MTPPHPDLSARLLISCPDRPGIVANVAQFLYRHGANIMDSSQHSTDPREGTFFMRMAFDLERVTLSQRELEQAFAEQVAQHFEMDWQIAYSGARKRVAIMVSKFDHCLLDLIWRWRRGELKMDIPMIISNHDDLRSVSESFDIPYYHLPVSKDSKEAQELEVLGLLEDRVDLIVLARYMQILSPAFVNRYPGRIINIHHSFLPAFVGANPYKHAYQRGVKLIGATAHYVTEALDEGPIIEQDVARVSHRDSLQDLVRIGREIERAVLARAVLAHVEDRVLMFENKTVVF